MSTKTISDNCTSLVKEFEGCSLTAYQDEVGVWTIGYGTTNSDKEITGTTIKSGLKITQSTADKWLTDSLKQKYVPLVLKYDGTYDWNQNELDALTSFAYNIGSISQLTDCGTRSRKTISEKMLEYNKAGGKVLNGLVRRREAEQALFLKPVDYTEERVIGLNYFNAVKSSKTTNITSFLHKRNYGAGKKNLRKIARENATSTEVKEALFALAKKGLLVKPKKLNRWKKEG